jgi:CxxC motif-containing protein (DUF1111 family)
MCNGLRLGTITARRAAAPGLRLVAAALLVAACQSVPYRPTAPAGVVDPGFDPKAAARAGGPLPGMSAGEVQAFGAAVKTFVEVDSVGGTFVSPDFGSETSAGLGPRFNAVGCAICHAHPTVGGSSPPVNPQILVAHDAGASNAIPFFITRDGPIREARFKFALDAAGRMITPPTRDGGVHADFTVTGRADAPGCSIAQPPFDAARAQDNIALRIPTPLFGLGLIEAIPDETIVSEHARTRTARAEMQIAGRPNRGRENRTGNDSTITRFGWKAQNKSLSIFAGEAYNVEQGVTNELFPNERDTEATPLPAACFFNPTPEDHSNLDSLTQGATFSSASSDIVNFEIFMRFLAPPAPACDSFAVPSPCAPNIAAGRAIFDRIGCALCHAPELPLGRSSSAAITRQKTARLFSDLLVHHMGDQLADGITQGLAGDDEFRTAPLWGAGQRVFFLHDGRTKDLVQAILQHAGDGSEANRVVRRFEHLSKKEGQELIDFLRSL